MSDYGDYLGRLVARSFDLPEAMRPRPVALFEATPAAPARGAEAPAGERPDEPAPAGAVERSRPGPPGARRGTVEPVQGESAGGGQGRGRGGRPGQRGGARPGEEPGEPPGGRSGERSGERPGAWLGAPARGEAPLSSSAEAWAVAAPLTVPRPEASPGPPSRPATDRPAAPFPELSPAPEPGRIPSASASPARPGAVQPLGRELIVGGAAEVGRLAGAQRTLARPRLDASAPLEPAAAEGWPQPAPLMPGAAQPTLGRPTQPPVIVPPPGEERAQRGSPASPQPAVTPTIHVTIGRVDVRASPQPAAAPRRRGAPPAVMTLEEYLKRRAGRGKA